MKHLSKYKDFAVGQIQYYLYNGSNKEGKVSKDQFFNSSGVKITHFDKKPEKQSTKSQTGKVIERIKDFSDFTDTSALMYGDGPSVKPRPDTFKQNVKSVDKKKGNTAREEQKKRKEKYKKNSKQQRIEKISDFSTTDDLVSTTTVVHKVGIGGGTAT